jgi:hypothetical protein
MKKVETRTLLLIRKVLEVLFSPYVGNINVNTSLCLTKHRAMKTNPLLN